MLNREPEPMNVEAFFAWQERQTEFFMLLNRAAFPTGPRLVQDEPPGAGA